MGSLYDPYKTPRKPARRANIEREDHLLPWVITESVVREAAVWLAARAARVYASSAHFRTFGSPLLVVDKTRRGVADTLGTTRRRFYIPTAACSALA